MNTALTFYTRAVLQGGASPAPIDDLSEYKRWECGRCNTTHTSESAAKDCCRPEVDVVYEHPTTGETFDTANELAEAMGGTSADALHCPACGDEHGDAYDAASCCMWRDFSVAARWRLASAVTRGETWAAAVAAEAALLTN